MKTAKFKYLILDFYCWLWSLIHPCKIGFNEYDHDHEWIDDSFDHEYGTETCGHWECINCGHIGEGEPPTYDEYYD